ncbi:Chromodomain Y-like protein 2 [Dermatophagoides farinae]|uniref:Chromodomain Y-like protein 2 n=1 Tax=Dermatophagoides farinae TaxID=6954 RepID=A0A922I1C5_DERFA|nr:Chromodomain Y-like protein 2 [Dermatophagoides farinae]
MERTMESMKTLKKSTISVSQNCRQPQQQQQRRRRGRGRRHHFTTRKSSKFYDENRYEVSRIIKHRQNFTGKIEFLIEWTGYHTKTWEPFENLDRCKQLLREYLDYFRLNNQLDDESFSQFVYRILGRQTKYLNFFLHFSTTTRSKIQTPTPTKKHYLVDDFKKSNFQKF